MLVALYRSRSPLASVDLSFAICVTEALRPATTVGAWPENGYLRLVIESLDDDRRAFRVAQRHGRATRRRQGCGGGVGRRDVEVAAGGRGVSVSIGVWPGRAGLPSLVSQVAFGYVAGRIRLDLDAGPGVQSPKLRAELRRRRLPGPSSRVRLSSAFSGRDLGTARTGRALRIVARPPWA